MNVKAIMTTDVVVTTPQTPLKDAAELLAEHGVSGMPVLADDGAVVGVLSEADILAKQHVRADVRRRLRRPAPADPKFRAHTVGDAMTAPALTTPPFASVSTAAGRMLDHGVNRLPVVQHGRLVGIVTRADLVRAFVRTDEEIEAEAREQLELQQSMLADGSVLAVEVRDGAATLTGHVRRRDDAELLPRLIRAVPGVVEVRSDLSWSVES